MDKETHHKIRNLIAMILLPKKLHKNDESQAAFLRAAISRVSSIYTEVYLEFWSQRLPLQCCFVDQDKKNLVYLGQQLLVNSFRLRTQQF